MAEHTGVDPGFPIEGGADPPGGCQHMILPKFMKNCMKLRKFWAVGGTHWVHPLNPPLKVDKYLCIQNNAMI